jgi:flagellar biogenesis protein FliO
LIAAPEAPSLMAAFIRVGLAVLVLALVAGLWFYWNRKVKGPSRHLEVLDRAFLARGACVTLLRVDERRLLVGVSTEGVRLLSRLEDGLETGEQEAFPAVLGRSAARREAREC